MILLQTNLSLKKQQIDIFLTFVLYLLNIQLTMYTIIPHNIFEIY